MRKNKTNNEKRTQLTQKDITSNYIIELIFKDYYEYEAFFEVICKKGMDKFLPNRLRINFNLNAKVLELCVPDNERIVELIVPITKGQNNIRTKEKLAKRYIDEFGSIIYNIRLNVQNRIVALSKLIGVDPKVKVYVDKLASEKRRLAIKNAK